MYGTTMKNTLHVSNCLSFHYQDSKTVHTSPGICHTGSVAACYWEWDGTHFTYRNFGSWFRR